MDNPAATVAASESSDNIPTPFHVSLISGGLAGTAVDVSLFPLDTIKTRLQSEKGFLRSGGFRNVYAGIGPSAAGAAPTAAVFFCTYDSTKHLLLSSSVLPTPVVHMTAASLGELASCLVRVPVEIIKQRRQTDTRGLSSADIVRETLKKEGFRGLYRGFLTTVIREIPFTLTELPLWEHLKATWARSQGRPVDPWQSAVCGAISGGISAAITTPLDVAKTRIMLAEAGSDIAVKASIVHTLQTVVGERGLAGIFAGILPRVLWISVGGAMFFGMYEKSKSVLTAK